MPQIVPLEVDGVTRQCVEVDFEPVSEPWADYRLTDGGRVRARLTLTRIYRVLDAEGKPALRGGDPWYVVRHQIQYASSA